MDYVIILLLIVLIILVVISLFKNIIPSSKIFNLLLTAVVNTIYSSPETP